MADTIPGNTGSSTTIQVGSSATSEIDTAGDSDWWRVTFDAGFAYHVSLQGSQDGFGTLRDPLLRVHGATGTQLAQNDDEDATSLDAFIEFQPSSFGTYFIAASSAVGSGVGSYTLSIYRDALASTASAALLPVDDTLGGWAEDLGYRGDLADWVRVQLQAGVEYVFDLIGAAYDGADAGYTLADPWMALRNAQGIELSRDDESGVGHNARLVFTPTVSGSYFLDAQGFEVSDFGNYLLLVNAAPRAGTLTPGVPTSGALAHDGDVRWYPLDVQSGRHYLIEAGGGSLADPLLELLYADGTVYDYDNDSGPGLSARIGFSPETSGSWLLAVRASGHAGLGSFNLSVRDVPLLTLADATVTEGSGGSTELVFVASLSRAAAQAVSFQLTTDDSVRVATDGVDYLSRSATLTIPAGQTRVEFRVTVLGDTTPEALEAVVVNLTGGNDVVVGRARASGLILDDDTPRPTSDPLLPQQWHLYPGAGANVLPVWSDYRGTGVRVVVFDQGVDAGNPDLVANVLGTAGRNAADLSLGGAPLDAEDNHGTAVAGVIAGAADNGGLVGVAPGARIVSIYSPLTLDDNFAQSVTNALTHARGFDVLNNSWGTGNLLLSNTNYAFYDDFGDPTWAPAAAALKALADQGRGGLGTVVVQSAGNAYDVGDDTNLHNFQNSRYIITVAATGIEGRTASYSSTGASILVAAPGGDGEDAFGQILTTDRMGAAGYEGGSTAAVSGTSFSSPVVAGIVALMLEANPRLGYRDVMEILVRTARLTEADNNEWESNGAREINGGGGHVDTLRHDLGFGLVDARAAVRLAETWGSRNPQTSANVVERSQARVVDLPIPDNGLDNDTGPALDLIRFNEDLRVERAEVTLRVTHPWVGDLFVLLTSPSGISSFLVSRPASGALSAFGSSQSDIRFTFDTVLNWGENARGDWSLAVFDAQAGDVGRFDSWTLKLIGQAADADDVYSYTDEFAARVAAEPARATLADAGGRDVINAAAMSAASRIDLSGLSQSHLGGTPLTLAAGTRIESAFGGDGNDTLIGGAEPSLLHGGRGSDSLVGGASPYDIASWIGPTAVDVDLVRGTALQGADVDRVSGIEALFGSSRNDTLRGRDGADHLRSDTLRGGAGNDSLEGRGGNDAAEFMGVRANYTVTRAGPGSDRITVVDTTGAEGTDTLLSIERLVFADRMLAFGTRAEEVARVAYVLWTPAISAHPSLFAMGFSYYDNGYSFSQLCDAALGWWPQQGREFANLLLRGTPGTTRTADDILAIMADAGGGQAGRVAALAAMANDPATTAQLSIQGVLLNGVLADLAVAGYGTLFTLLDGG